MTAFSRVQRLAAETPADRNRYVDLLRLVAIGMVVVGHWLAVVITTTDGQLRGQSVLAVLDWTHWVTWLFQVIPVFFLVGGYANAASWSSHRDRGGDWASWMHRRALRLLWPTTVFVGVGLVATLLARSLEVPQGMLDEVTWFLVIVFWFLAAYLVVTALAPVLLAAQERWASRPLAVVAAAVVLVDVVRLGLDVTWVGNANYVLVWVGIHLLGLAWWDGMLVASRRRLWSLAVIGTLALVGLTVAGPYPISMVNVPGAAVQNAAPPTVALGALGTAQTGLLLLVRRPARCWLRRQRVWTAVVAGNAVIMTLFLWHVIPVVVTAPLLFQTGVFPSPPIDSAAWLALRVPWVAAQAALLAGILVAAGRFEQPPGSIRITTGEGRTRVATVLGGAGVAAVAIGILLLTDRGLFYPGGPVGLPLIALGVYLAGVIALHVAGRRATWPDQDDGDRAR